MTDLTTIIAHHIEHPDHKRLAENPAISLIEVRLQHDALIGLALDIEDAFGIELTDSAIHSWHSIGCIHRAVAMSELIAGDADLAA